MRRHWILLVVIGLLALSTAAPIASAQANNSTATATPAPTPTPQPDQPAATPAEPPGEFSLTELRRGGTKDAEAPPSVRMIGSPVSGGIGMRIQPANPLRNEWQWVKQGQTIQRNQVQLYSTAFGSTAGEYTLHTVYWQPETRQIQTENGATTQRYAANQTHERTAITLRNGYDTTNVSLAPHYDQAYEVTMWLEDSSGEPVEGARWRFTHKSIPSTAGVNIDSQGDAWRYTAFNALFPGAIGVAAGLILSRWTLKRTGTGPRQGWLLWGLAVLFGGMLVVGAAYYQLAVIVARLPWLMGLSLGVIAYVGGMRMHPDLETLAFERQELQEALPLRNRDHDTTTDATADEDVAADGGTQRGGTIEITKDDYKEELYEDQIQLPSVRMEDGTRRLPVSGIRPWLARLFASAAELDITELRTRIRVRDGPVDEKIYIDPDAETAVTHYRARLERQIPFWSDLHDEDREDDPSPKEKLVSGALAASVLLGLPIIGMQLLDQSLGLPGVGFLLGAVPAVIMSYTARDGHLEFDPAPIHHRSAKATLVALQKEHADAKLLEEYEEIAWRERTRSAQEARDLERRRDETYVRETFGGDSIDDVEDIDAATDGGDRRGQ